MREDHTPRSEATENSSDAAAATSSAPPDHPAPPQALPRPLLDRETVEARVAELAREIEGDYRDSDRLIAVGVLNGSVFFLVDLLRRINLPLRVDFFQTQSYGDATEPGDLKILKDVDSSVRGADVLLIEDIVDTGQTLATLLDKLRHRGARSVKLCTLLDKPSRRRVDVPIDYCGFAIDDHFVVGYGLDHAGFHRNLPYIGIVES